MAQAHVPGLALALVRDGQVVYVKGYGERDTGRQLPLQADTVMYAASLTKATFAYGVMMMADEGRIDLDRSIDALLAKPLPEYDKYADLAGDERWRLLTPRILLSHRSGFANFRFWQPGKPYDPDGKLFFYFDPGTRFAYSGEGINLLQFALENGGGIDVGDYLGTHLFERFGMTRTSLTWRSDFEGNVAIGYDEHGAALGHKQRGSVRAAGSMDTTVDDYAHLLAAMVRGDGLRPRRTRRGRRRRCASDPRSSSRRWASPTPTTTTASRCRTRSASRASNRRAARPGSRRATTTAPTTSRSASRARATACCS